MMDSETKRLQWLVGGIIPASSEFGVPGADDAHIFADILAALQPAAGAVSAMLSAMNDDACDDLQAEIKRLRQAHAAAFSAVIRAVAICYYRDDRVLTALGMEGRPPFPQGYAMAEGDWSLLEPVRRRVPIWRPAP